MYNEDRKLRFLSEAGLFDQKNQWAFSMFRQTRQIEEALSKDLAEFTADEVGVALSTSGVVSHITVMNRIPLVVRYKKWCKEHGFKTVQVRSDEISPDVSENIRDTMVYSPSYLASLLREAFRDNLEKSSKCVYRAYLWLGFAGMSSEDAANVRVSDVDLKRRMILYNNRYYQVPEEGAGDLETVCAATEFTRIVNGGVAVFKREDGDRILRGRKLTKKIPVNEYVRSTLRPTVQRGFQQIGHGGMSYLRVRKSGLFYEMLRREVHGFLINFAPIAYDDYMSGNHKESNPSSKQKTISRIMLMYERDYAAWKKAFDRELREEFRVNIIPSSEV